MALPKTTLERLTYQHQTLTIFVDALNPDQMHAEFNPGKWSIHQNIAHLACYQPQFILRIRVILDRDKPVFERYSAENDAAFASYEQMKTAELFGELERTRTQIINLLINLSHEQLLRTGYHPKNGWMDITWWTEFFLLHEAHHIYTVFNLARRLQLTENKPS